MGINTDTFGQATVTVFAVKAQTRTNKVNGVKFQAKILSTDSLGLCSITEMDTGYADVVEGEKYEVTYSRNGSYTNVKSAKRVEGVDHSGPESDSENGYELPIDFDIAIPEVNQPPKQQAESKTVNTVTPVDSVASVASVVRAVLSSIDKMQKTLEDIGEKFGKLSEEFKSLKTELESKV